MREQNERNSIEFGSVRITSFGELGHNLKHLSLSQIHMHIDNKVQLLEEVREPRRVHISAVAAQIGALSSVLVVESLVVYYQAVSTRLSLHLIALIWSQLFANVR